MNVRLVLLLFAIAVPTTAQAQMVSVPGVVVEATPIRIDPSATVPLTTLPRGMDVVVIAVENNWVQVAFEDLRYGRRVGYVPKTMVSFAMPGLPAPAQPASASVASLPAPAPAKPATSKPAKGTAPATSVATGKTPATSSGAATAAAAKAPAVAAAPAAPAPRPPIRLVESEFPAVGPTTPAKPHAAAAGATTTTPSAKPPAKPAAPPVRPPVRLVEHDFPASVAAPAVASPKLRPVTSGMTPAPSATPATPAALAPVRLVEGDFPAVAPSSSTPAPAERQPASRVVIPIGNAFPEATGSAPTVPVTTPVTAPPSSEETAPSEQK